MKIKIVRESKKNKLLRVKLAEGEAGDEAFTFSVLADGSGVIIEFEKDAYILTTEELVKEVIKLVHWKPSEGVKKE